MSGNVFDQFDGDMGASAPAQASGNVFDQFDNDPIGGSVAPVGQTFTGTAPVASQAQPSTAMDVTRSAGSGLRSAAEGMAGLPGDVEAGENWLLDKVMPTPSGGQDPAVLRAQANVIPEPPTSAQIDKGVTAVAGPAYQPKTTAGKYAQAIAEFVPAAIGGEGGVIRRAAQVAVPAVASQSAGDAAAALGASPGVQSAIKIATALGTGMATAPGAASTAPSLAAVKSAATSGFDAARGVGLELKPTGVQSLAQNIQQSLYNDGFRDYLAPKTYATLNSLANPPSGATVTGTDLMGLRQVLGKIAGSNDPTEQAAAVRVKGALDNYLGSVPPNDVVKGDPAQFSTLFSDANANYASAMTGQNVQDKINKADLQAASTYSGGNLNNATRQNLRQLVTSKNQSRGLTPDELAMIESTVRGSPTGNILRATGKLLGGGGGWGGAVESLLAGAHFGPIGFAAAPAGYVIKKAGDYLTARNADAIVNMITNRSPLGQTLQAAAPAAPSRLPPGLLAAVLAAAPPSPSR